jgi:hypothetical protein
MNMVLPIPALKIAQQRTPIRDKHTLVPERNMYTPMNTSSGCIPDAILFDLDNTLCTFIDAKYADAVRSRTISGPGMKQNFFNIFFGGTLI